MVLGGNRIKIGIFYFYFMRVMSENIMIGEKHGGIAHIPSNEELTTNVERSSL